MPKKAKKPVDCPQCQIHLEDLPENFEEFKHINHHNGPKQAAVYINALLKNFHQNHI